MNREFIPYEQALELKELGFNETCLAFYGGDGDSKVYYNSLRNGSGDYEPYKASERLKWFGAPLYQQAFRWFREKHDLFGCIDLQACVPSHWFIRIDKIEINDYLYHSEDKDMRFNTYEEAELECLKKLIEISKNERK